MAESSRAHDDISRGVEEIFPRLWRYALAMTGARDLADDLAQSTVLRALERRDQYQKGTRLDAWMFRICQRLWIDEVRKIAVRRGGGLVPIEEHDLPGNDPGAETNIFLRETLYQIMHLPEAQRATVILVYIEGYSYAEAAEILDIPIGTVMSRLAAARKKLVSVLKCDKGEAK